MKKILVCLLMLALLTATAFADATVVKTAELKGNVTLCDYSGNYIARTDSGYCLFAPDGSVLSAPYKSMSAADDGQYIKVQNVSNADNLNCVGLLDAQGKEILPLQYGSIITYYAEDWVFAHVLAPAEGDVGEYSDSKGNKYNIQSTDVVYKGQMIGTLSREEYQAAFRVTDRGPSIFIRISDQKGYWLNSDFTRLYVTDDSYIDTSEYSWGYNKPVIHNPTQQQAFTASCTLTPDDVKQHVWYDEKNAQILDLQGNVLAQNINCNRATYRVNYMELETNSYKYSGIMTFDGQVIVPSQYEYIAHNYNGYFRSGYNAVIDDKGNLYFYDEAGNITASAEYELSYNDYKGFTYNAPMVHVKNMGKYMIITATHGTLPEVFEEVVTCGELQKIMAVKKDGMWGVIDMAGNTVVPFEYTYTPDISDDGMVILCQKSYNEYLLHQLSYGGASSVPSSWTETKVSGQEEADAEIVLAEGAWECTCGVITNGKFCPECGSKKPEPTATPEPTPAPVADDGSWTCTCGSVNAGKFCPECGTKKPEATPVPEPQCASCGYKPEGATPKFCPECGTKF